MPYLKVTFKCFTPKRTLFEGSFRVPVPASSDSPPFVLPKLPSFELPSFPEETKKETAPGKEEDSKPFTLPSLGLPDVSGFSLPKLPTFELPSFPDPASLLPPPGKDEAPEPAKAASPSDSGGFALPSLPSFELPTLPLPPLPDIPFPASFDYETTTEPD